MSKRIAERYKKLAAEQRAGLITYTMAHDPSADAALKLMQGLPAAGADILEIGMPFSDPMADGKIIQAAGLRARAQGAKLKGVLDMVKQFRTNDNETPVIIMGYYNPIYHYGGEKFARDAAASGVDGVLIVDLPPEEEDELVSVMKPHGVQMVRLVTPTSDEARLTLLLKNAEGFLYYIAVAGVTGTKSAEMGGLEARVATLKAATKLPIAVGFGIKTPEQAAHIATFADSVVVGSALVDVIAQNTAKPDVAVEKALAFVGEISSAVRAVKKPGKASAA